MTNTSVKTLISWSGGKDSAALLHTLRHDKKFKIAGLMTTFSGGEEVNLHHVPRSLIEEQARSLNLPLFPVEISHKAPNEEYEEAHRALLNDVHFRLGIDSVAFGDIFQDEIRKYRENLVGPTNVKPLFPLWNYGSRELVRYFLKSGFKAICVSARDDLPGEKFAGKIMGEKFFKKLPAHVDPCGENGEYHSFVYHGPGFAFPLSVTPGIPEHKDYNPEVNLKMYLSKLQKQQV